MSHAIVSELRASTDAAAANLRAQLEGLEPYLEQRDAPGQWTAREVLCHLLFEPDFEPAAFLRTFAITDPPVVDVPLGVTEVTPARATMTVKEFAQALEAQRGQVFDYLETLGEADLGRRVRIPVFKPLLGTEEITLPVFVGAMFGHHWNDHAGQLAKIRAAAGLPAAG
jgi:hypothetical protein